MTTRNIEYIVINVDYDNGESIRQEFKDLKELNDEFILDQDILLDLLSSGVYEWEWGTYHLIKLKEYK